MICPYCNGAGRIEAGRAGMGALIKAARKRIGITQEELAQRVGCTRVWIGYVETGRHPPNIRVLRRWARALEVPVDELVP